MAGVSTSALSAVDMALWDALAKVAGLPLARLLGRTIGPVRAYNSNGLWRDEVSSLAAEAKGLMEDGGFTALKMRLGNEHRDAPLPRTRRAGSLLVRGVDRIRQPRCYAQLASKVRTPLQAGENYYGARDRLNFPESGGVHYTMGDLVRIGGVTGWMRTVGVAVAAGIQFSSHLYPEFAAHLLRVTPTAHWLEWVGWAHPILAAPLQPDAGMGSPFPPAPA